MIQKKKNKKKNDNKKKKKKKKSKTKTKKQTTKPLNPFLLERMENLTYPHFSIV